MDYAKISINPNGRVINMAISIIDNIKDTISDTESNDIEYILMHEAVNKGKNVKIRLRRIKF